MCLIMNYFLKNLWNQGKEGNRSEVFGSNLDPFLNSSFSLATLQDSGNADSKIERFMRSVMGLDSILAPSLRKVPDKPSILLY